MAEGSSKRESSLPKRKTNICEKVDLSKMEGPPAISSSKAGKMEQKRKRIAQELLDTEETYVENLNIVLNVFFEPLLKNAQGPESSRVISTDDVRNIFGSLKMIKPINEMLLERLRAKINVPDKEPVVIGETFISVAQYFKSYSNYCNDFDKAGKILARLRKTNPAFEALLTKINNPSLTENKTLRDYLIMPVQRVPRYKLLLTRILEYTAVDHLDYHNLETVVETISEIADSVEQAQEKYKNIDKIIELQNLFKGRKLPMPLLQPHRIFFLELVTDISIGDTEYREGGKSRKLLLFNDILIIAKASTDRRSKREVLKYQQSYPITSSVEPIKHSSSDPSQPSITIVFKSCNTTLNLFVDNPKDRDTWFNVLSDCKSSISKNNLRVCKEAKPTGSKIRRRTLRRRDTFKPGEIKITEVKNPLFQGGKSLGGSSLASRKFGTVDGNLNLNLSPLPSDDNMKKSTSMNAILEISPNPWDSSSQLLPSGFPPPNLARQLSTAEKRKNLSRSTSACLGKVSSTNEIKRTPPLL